MTLDRKSCQQQRVIRRPRTCKHMRKAWRNRNSDSRNSLEISRRYITIKMFYLSLHLKPEIIRLCKRCYLNSSASIKLRSFMGQRMGQSKTTSKRDGIIGSRKLCKLSKFINLLTKFHQGHKTTFQKLWSQSETQSISCSIKIHTIEYCKAWSKTKR